MPDMGATKRLSNGETKHVGPHPGTIRVSTQFKTQNAINKQLHEHTSQLDMQERSTAEAREDSIRLQGVTWIDTVRRALQLPIRTYETACVYFHKFRLAHGGTLTGMEYGNAWADACAASLLTACKVEDTLKKSRDILAAAYNLKASVHDQVGADDPMFEGPSKVVIGLERLVLEAAGFDFRSKHPHKLLAKVVKHMTKGQPEEEGRQLCKLAWAVCTDLYRTYAPLKMTEMTMALASLELAVQLTALGTPNNVSAVRDKLQQLDLHEWQTSREELMETLLDLLDLYTQHTALANLGTKYSLDDFLRIRLAFNKECTEANLARYTAKPAASATTLQVSNGHPTPVSPGEPGPQQPAQSATSAPAEAGGGTLRFMLDPQRAADERAEVAKYFVQEWEEYEEEVEVPVEAPPPQSQPPQREAERERERAREREREAERERARVREVERERRYARYDERERRGDRGSRYEDDRRRR